MEIFNHLNQLYNYFRNELNFTFNSWFNFNTPQTFSNSIFNYCKESITPNIDVIEIKRPHNKEITNVAKTATTKKTTAKAKTNTKAKTTTKATIQETAKKTIKKVTKPIVTLARNAAETFSFLKSIGYNEKAANKLAHTALKNTHGRRKSTHMCAKGVKTAIKDSGLGQYKSGHAYDIPRILASNPNFKEVPVSSVDWRNLPSGCIKWYAPGSAGYSKQYGHVAITGKNKNEEISDFIARINPNRKPDKIYIPVTTA